jgi:hypothetical protein
MTDLVIADFRPIDMNTGHVYASRMLLSVWGDGNWSFSGNLDDTSVLYGDNYAIGFSFKDGDLAGVKTGELGADETSTPQHIKFGIHGRSEDLQRNFLQAIQGGVKFSLHRSADVAQAFSDLGDDLKWLGRQIKFLFHWDSQGQGSDGTNISTPVAGPGSPHEGEL